MRSRTIHRWNSKTAFTLASFFCLFLFGLFDSLKGSTLSTLLKDLGSLTVEYQKKYSHVA